MYAPNILRNLGTKKIIRWAPGLQKALTRKETSTQKHTIQNGNGKLQPLAVGLTGSFSEEVTFNSKSEN